VTTANIGQAEFVKQTNRTCREAWPTIVDNFAKYSSWQDPKLSERRGFAEAVQLSLLAGIDFHIFDEIHDSPVPDGQGDDVEEIIGTMQYAVEQGQQRLAPIATPAQVVALFADYNALAREYGLGDCLVDRARMRQLDAARAAGPS